MRKEEGKSGDETIEKGKGGRRFKRKADMRGQGKEKRNKE